MTDEHAIQIWNQLRENLEEKLQYGLLDQVRRVNAVRLEGDELILVTSDDETFQFFSAEVNQHRIVIACRSIIALDKVRVELLNE